MARKIIIITAPSGAGKTSITKRLLAKYPKLAFSISAATREPRGNEKSGVDYHFMSVEDFQNKIHENAFIEWEMVYEGKYYGTLKSEITRIWGEEKIPMLDIDVQGAIHVQEEYDKETLSIFIKPPSVDELRKRLTGRGTDDEEAVATRLSKAAYELSFAHHFDHVIVNDDLDKATAATEKVITDFLQWEVN